MQKTVQSLGQEDPLEEEMATRSSILAWRIPRTEEPGGLQSIGLQSQRQMSDLACTSPLQPQAHLSSLIWQVPFVNPLFCNLLFCNPKRPCAPGNYFLPQVTLLREPLVSLPFPRAFWGWQVWERFSILIFHLEIWFFLGQRNGT